MCLNAGITYKDVAEVLREVFVESARDGFGVRGRPANNSRIAILTGISRKEVRRIKDLLPVEKGTPRNASPLGKLLSAWHNDPRFTDKQGKPAGLKYKGKHSTFSQLAREYAGDVPVSALLKELERHELVEESVDGRIKPTAKVFIPKKSSVDALERLGEVVGELGGTIVDNLDKSKESRFERRVLTGQISIEDSRNFHALVEKQGNGFLEFMDSWLYEKGLSDVNEPRENGTCRAGVGVYFFEEQLD